MGFPSDSVVKNPLAMQETQETWVRSLGQEDPLEEEMATHSSVLAWRIPGREEPGGLQSMRSHRVRLNRRMSASTSTSITEMFSSLLRVPGETEISRLLCFSFK